MTCIVLLEVAVQPGKLDEAKTMLAGMLPTTRSYTGCKSLIATNNIGDPNSICLVEQWESQAAYETYLAWRKTTPEMAAISALFAGPPTIRFFGDMGV
jgi:quinol monooxygenase YgiN